MKNSIRIFRRLMPASTPEVCSHLAAVEELPEPDTRLCGQCIEMGDSWVHLRMCLECGQVGCCDSSKNRHASAHAKEVGHPVARSIEPGEHWAWCFVDFDERDFPVSDEAGA